MKNLLALPHGGDLDLTASARILQLTLPSIVFLQPKRLNQNAWSIIRKRSLFEFFPLGNIQWEKIEAVHLLGISQGRQNPELIKKLAGFSGSIHVYGGIPPTFSFPVDHERIKCLSMTAWLMLKKELNFDTLSPQDALLFRTAIFEKTQAFLAAKTTNLDLEALSRLRCFPHQSRQISNQIHLGLRDGQKGLFHDLMKCAIDFECHNIPGIFALVRSLGNISEIFPVVDRLWSRLDPQLLVVGIISHGKAHFWLRHRIPNLRLLPAFQEFRARQEHQWIFFSVTEKDPQNLRDKIFSILQKNLVGEPIAEEIMVSPPHTVDIEESVRNTLQLMLKFNLMGLIVTKERKFAGVISRRDLDRAVQMELLESPINPFVNFDCPAISPEMPVRVIKHLMTHQNITRVPVVRGNEVLGIITSREVLRRLPSNVPLPPQYLPITRTHSLPTPETLFEPAKRVVSLKVLHFWKKIGEKAKELFSKVYLVGGVVRDLLLERPNFDMDFVVIGDAIPFAREVEKELKGEIRVFERFHTARVTIDNIKLDFASARIEHYAHAGALPYVEFSGLSNDLFRRDFSINALALDLSPENFLQLIDFFGGYEHLKDRKIKILHSFSFLEDPTRIFRAIRFASRFHFHLSEDTQRALDVAMDREIILKLSSQRICAEVSKCFSEEKPASIIQKLLETGILQFLHEALNPNLLLPVRFRLIPASVRRFNAMQETIDTEVIHWTGLFSLLTPNEADSLLKKANFHADRREKIFKSLVAIRNVPQKINTIAPTSVFEVYKLLSPLPLEGLIGLTLFGLDKNGAKRLFEYIETTRMKRCEITGKDLKGLGITPGPVFSIILDEVLQKKLGGELKDRKDELNYVRKKFADLCVSKSA